jgi:hypothetical protein
VRCGRGVFACRDAADRKLRAASHCRGIW